MRVGGLALLLGAVAAATPRAGGAQRTPASATVAETLHVYGPGGPLPAMKDAAAEFGRRRGIVVEVRGGPTPQWLARAKGDADLIYSGSEHMMTDFVGQLARADVGGKPKRIRRFEDLLRPGVEVLVVQGGWSDRTVGGGGRPTSWPSRRSGWCIATAASR